MDVARRAGCSVQQVRVLEREGVLPPAARTPSGYRVFTDVHVRSALAYRALAVAVGPVQAKRIMRAVHCAPVPTICSLIETAHVRLHAEREGLRLAREAAAAIAGEPLGEAGPGDAMTISELAGALGVRTSALRHWEAEGLIAPARSARGSRRYAPEDVRDARIVHQLRQAGHRIPSLRELMPRVRRRHVDEIRGALHEREAALNSRSRHLLRASALLDALLEPPREE